MKDLPPFSLLFKYLNLTLNSTVPNEKAVP